MKRENYDNSMGIINPSDSSKKHGSQKRRKNVKESGSQRGNFFSGPLLEKKTQNKAPWAYHREGGRDELMKYEAKKCSEK